MSGQGACRRGACWLLPFARLPGLVLSLLLLSPMGIACEFFKTEYDLILNNTIAGAHATRVCDALARPVLVIPP